MAEARIHLFRNGPALVTAASAMAAVAPVAYADEDSDFLGCLSNHNVTWDDENAMVQVLDNAQQVMPEVQVFYLTRHGLDQGTAQKVAQCVQAATLMNGH